MLDYHSETWRDVKDEVKLDDNLRWLAQRGFLHISTARERGRLVGYVLSIFSGTDPLHADFVEAKDADEELLAKDKQFLHWHGVSKIVRGDKVIWTN